MQIVAAISSLEENNWMPNRDCACDSVRPPVHAPNQRHCITSLLTRKPQRVLRFGKYGLLNVYHFNPRSKSESFKARYRFVSTGLVMRIISHMSRNLDTVTEGTWDLSFAGHFTRWAYMEHALRTL